MGHKEKKKKKHRQPAKTTDTAKTGAMPEAWIAAPKEGEKAWAERLLEEAARHRAALSEPQAAETEGTASAAPLSPPEPLPTFVGSPRPVLRGLGYYALRAFFILVAVGFIFWLWGALQRQGKLDLFSWLSLGRQPTLELVDARGEYVLLVETSGKRSQVLMQTSPQGSWLRVSRDDPNAVNPALSPTTKHVAYLSLQDESQVVIAPLDDTKPRTTITATDLEAAAVARKSSNVTFCDWTPLAWDPDGHRLAFFGCRKEKPRSMVFVARIDMDQGELELIPDSEADAADPRQLRWSGPDHVVLSLPAPGGEQIKTLPVP